MDNIRKKQIKVNSSNITGSIAISSGSNNLDGEIEPRFGRAADFIIFNLNNKTFEYLDNGLSQTQNQGIGVKTASTLVNKGVNIIITGSIGPKAYKVLAPSKIKMVQDLFNVSIRAAINLCRDCKLSYSNIPH